MLVPCKMGRNGTKLARFNLRAPYGPLIPEEEEEQSLPDPASSNRVTAKGETCLFFYVERNRPHVVTWLLDQGAEVNPYQYRQTQSAPEIKWTKSPLQSAIRNGHDLIVKMFLDRGVVNIEAPFRDLANGTPLSTAISYSNAKIVHMLLEAGAVLSSQAVKAAAIMLNVEIMSLLFSHGLTIDRISQFCPLERSFEQAGLFPCCRLFAETPHICLEACKWLLARGAHNFEDNLLAKAMRTRAYDVVPLLIAASSTGPIPIRADAALFRTATIPWPGQFDGFIKALKQIALAGDFMDYRSLDNMLREKSRTQSSSTVTKFTVYLQESPNRCEAWKAFIYWLRLHQSVRPLIDQCAFQLMVLPRIESCESLFPKLLWDYVMKLRTEYLGFYD
jgi:Ankyrin repeats (3 copies)